MTKQIIDIEECSGCGVCVDMCPNEVYDLKDDVCVAVNSDNCDGCAICVDECAMECIELQD